MNNASLDHLIYKADLQHAGTAVSETMIILREYPKHQDWRELRSSVLKENLLKKRTSVTANNILRAVRKRFFEDHFPLPSVDSVSHMVVTDASPISKAQILYPYICRADGLVEQAVLRLVKPRIENSFSPNLTKGDVVSFLREESSSHPELKSWAGSLTARWARGFLTLLRNFGMMKPAPESQLLVPRVRVETFAFFFLGLLESDFSPVHAMENPLWDLYFLKKPEIERLLVEAQARGWIYYSKAGDITELKPRYSSLKEWLKGGLEH